YVSYGMHNSQSSYIIDIINPASVTIDYQAIMNGSSQSSGNTVGETVNEWITFGITSPAPFYSISGKVYHDANANGTLDSGETGLGGVTVKLTDCNGTTKNTTTTASDGSYSFNLGTSLPSTALCVVEPNNLPNYLFDTTPNTIKLALSNTQYSYPNNNFGDSTISPLTLNKYQAANDCNITNLTTLTYSKQPISLTKEQRGQCIAYRIEAVNTGSTALTNVVINDPLMNDAQRVNKLYTQSAQPTLCGSDNTSSSTCDTKKASYNTDEQGVTTITTSGFGLPGSGNNKSANLYFNTKYQIK
ncbi:SdrD B-like domain-containing protein, partial [Moraxella atlantae]